MDPNHIKHGHLKHGLLGLSLLLPIEIADAAAEAAPRPNFVVIFCDDLGYGDLGCFGNPTIQTPHLDRMAAEGQRWTQFYVAAPVCTPSRAALLTGRLPVRNGMAGDKARVLFPDSHLGLAAEEVTIAEALRGSGYRTMIVGKWHLGHKEEYLPLRHGFDQWFGLPYSNDMDFVRSPDGNYRNVPLYRDDEIIERPADQTTITNRYADEAVRFIEENREGPFFLYLAHSMPHIPLFRSKASEGRSLRGLYGDVIEEIDDSVGRVLSALKDQGIDEQTIVCFTSDNGPWLTYKRNGGTAGLLKGGKGDTYEGGMRVPTIFRWPGQISPGMQPALGTTMDLLPTFCALAGTDLPATLQGQTIDGVDLSQTLTDGADSPRTVVPYYRNRILHALRVGPYKAHFTTWLSYRGEDPVPHDPPLLYNLEHDPSERFDIAKKHPDVVAEIIRERDALLDSFEMPPSRLDPRGD